MEERGVDMTRLLYRDEMSLDSVKASIGAALLALAASLPTGARPDIDPHDSPGMSTGPVCADNLEVGHAR